ncbi:MAG: DUF3267 domain-containing protein [Candidatus Cloacimonetes bacterium]|nr:DUF3267 domain-containing protein [Candidatus Cloacimonadota bacterium]
MKELNNYKKEELTINLVWANVFSIFVLAAAVVIYGLPYYLLRPHHFTAAHFQTMVDNNTLSFLGSAFLLAFIIIIIGIILHEFLHGITWALYTKKGFKSINFGIKWKMLAPYCHCKEPLKVKHYLLGTLMPAFILGFIPGIFSWVFGSLGLLVFGLFFTMVASGDLLVAYSLRKASANNLVQDHPSKVGCVIYQKK